MCKHVHSCVNGHTSELLHVLHMLLDGMACTQLVVEAKVLIPQETDHNRTQYTGNWMIVHWEAYALYVVPPTMEQLFFTMFFAVVYKCTTYPFIIMRALCRVWSVHTCTVSYCTFMYSTWTCTLPLDCCSKKSALHVYMYQCTKLHACKYSG